jgi:hypothetical protein
MTAGCSTISNNPGATDAFGNHVTTVVPNKALQLTRAISLSAENMVLGTALYWAIDPLAPNWQLAQAPEGEGRMRISLRKKHFTSGGDGEAAQLFARRAGQLAREGGYAGYSVMEYTEGIEFALPLAQRVAQGVVRLNR